MVREVVAAAAAELLLQDMYDVMQCGRGVCVGLVGSVAFASMLKDAN